MKKEKLSEYILREWHKVPYVWGGQSRKGIDCSGFVLEVFKEYYGKEIPDTTAEGLRKMAAPVKFPVEGDLIFFNTDQDAAADHVGIMVSPEVFAHAGSSTGVTFANVDNRYWEARFTHYGRIPL